MANWTDLHQHRHLISRVWYNVPGSVGIVAPAKAAFVRASAVGAGSIPASGGSGPGHGGAFSRVKKACAAADAFTVNLGAPDTTLTKVTGGSTVILKAAGAIASLPGDAANCIGDTKRSGSAAVGSIGGSSAGDDADLYPLGFGGRGASPLYGADPGGGGISNYLLLDYFYDDGSGPIHYTFPISVVAGNGLMCVEFFDQDPAIVITGY